MCVCVKVYDGDGFIYIVGIGRLRKKRWLFNWIEVVGCNHECFLYYTIPYHGGDDWESFVFIVKKEHKTMQHENLCFYFSISLFTCCYCYSFKYDMLDCVS